MKPVAFYLVFGACQQYKCVRVSQSAQKLVSNSFGCIIVIMLLFRHFLLLPSYRLASLLGQ